MKALLLNKLKLTSQWRYVLLLGLANAISIGRIFFYAKIISVEEFGAYATLALVSGVFTIIGSLGFLTELQRRLPVYFKNKDSLEGLITVVQAVIIIFCVTGVCTIIGLFASFAINIEALLIGILGGLSQLLFSVITSETRSRQLLIRFSNEILVRNLILLLLGAAIANFSSSGTWIFIVESISTILFTLFLFKRLIPDFVPIGYLKVIKKSGLKLKQINWTPVLSMLLIGVLAFAMQNGERYFAKTNLSLHTFAVLSFGLIIPNIATSIQAIFNSSVFTNQVLRFNESGHVGVIRYSIKISLILAAFFSCISIPMYIIAKEIISNYYPMYSEIISSLPIILVAFVIRCSDFISNIYIIINKPHYVVIVHTTYLMVLVAILLLGTRFINASNPLFYFTLNLVNAAIPTLIIIGLVLINYKSVNRH